MASEKSRTGEWTWMGRLDYFHAMALMERISKAVLAGRDGVLMLLEHPPVITLGHRETGKNVLASREELAARGIDVCKTDRGGFVTYHGPGQLIGYPVFRLGDLAASVGELVGKLEEVLRLLAMEFGVTAAVHPGLPGLWVEGGKLASIGLRIRRGVVGHGFSFNLKPDLSHFSLIVPCGLTGVGAVSVNSLVGLDPDIEDTAREAAVLFSEVFGIDLVETDCSHFMEGGG